MHLRMRPRHSQLTICIFGRHFLMLKRLCCGAFGPIFSLQSLYVLPQFYSMPGNGRWSVVRTDVSFLKHISMKQIGRVMKLEYQGFLCTVALVSMRRKSSAWPFRRTNESHHSSYREREPGLRGLKNIVLYLGASLWRSLVRNLKGGWRK